MKILDFRSDTVTKPSPQMWTRLIELTNEDIGDDVNHEDPTINKLEEIAAHLMGKEAALYCASGTMGNLISVLTHTQPGQEILLEKDSHIYLSEVGGLARIGGLIAKPFTSDLGVPYWDYLEGLIHSGDDIHNAKTGLICLENTHNYHGGTIMTPNDMSKAREISVKYDIPIHLDGSRIFNAAIAQEIDVKKLTEHVDSVQFCLSKGLSCPVGSIISGNKEFITRARKIRKMLGGGWRQAGIIASMGLEALTPTWIDRLHEDHENATLIYSEIENINPELIISKPQTNIIFIRFDTQEDAEKIFKLATDEGILSCVMNKRIRLVTHYGITAQDAIEGGKKLGMIIRKNIN